MNRRGRLAAALVILAVVWWPLTGAAEPQVLVITAKDTGKTFTVSVGQRLVVDLSLQGSQQVAAPEFNLEVLALVGQSLQSATGPQGTTVRVVYDFLVRQEGRTDLVINAAPTRSHKGSPTPLLKIKIVAGAGGQPV